MNFIYNEPTQESEGAFKTIVGSFDTIDTYGALSGGIVDDVLAGRLSFSNRTRDGYIGEAVVDAKGRLPGQDPLQRCPGRSSHGWR